MDEFLTLGENYFVRTVTDYWVGRLVKILGPYTVVLEEASWVANTGRLHVFMQRGRDQNTEVEPVGAVCCQWLAILPWPHDIFREAI